MREYYVAKDNEQNGPFTLNEVLASDIKSTTLVWFEGMENWERAENIDELKALFKTMPPPIPKQKEEKVHAVEAEIKEKQEIPIKPKTKIVAAKEIKTNFKLILIALAIALVSYPVFYQVIYKVNKYDTHAGVGTNGLNPNDFPFQLKINDDNVKLRKIVLTTKTRDSSIYIFFIASALLILGRYLQKAGSWVNSASSEDS